MATALSKPIKLDNAIMRQNADDHLVIKPRMGYTILLFLIIGLFGLGLLALVARVVLGILSGDIDISQALGPLFFVIAILVFLGFVLYSERERFNTPPVIINRSSRSIQIGRGQNTRTIPFSDVNNVFAQRVSASRMGRRGREANIILKYHLFLQLKSGDRIRIGIKSFQATKAQDLQAIIHSISQFIGNE